MSPCKNDWRLGMRTATWLSPIIKRQYQKISCKRASKGLEEPGGGFGGFGFQRIWFVSALSIHSPTLFAGASAAAFFISGSIPDRVFAGSPGIIRG
jgi:hypothetical protein